MTFRERSEWLLEWVFLDEQYLVIREEFLGFTSLNEMDAETIAGPIINQCNQYGLNLNKLRGQWYDGCSTMAGKKCMHVLKATIRWQYLSTVQPIASISWSTIWMQFRTYGIPLERWSHHEIFQREPETKKPNTKHAIVMWNKVKREIWKYKTLRWKLHRNSQKAGVFSAARI